MLGETVARVLEDTSKAVAIPRIHPSAAHWDLLKYIGDICHLMSFLILIINMKRKNKCLGISYRTQELYLIVFLVRYSDILFASQTPWNLTFKLLFIGFTCYIIYMMRFERPICVGYEASNDTFPHRITLIPIALVIGLLIPDYSIWAYWHPFFHRAYNFTVVLEALAILPQLTLLRKVREIEILPGAYIFLLGLYRGIYILSWTWRMFELEEYFSHIYIKFVFGVIQFLLFGDFFVNYIKCVRENKQYVNLPI